MFKNTFPFSGVLLSLGLLCTSADHIQFSGLDLHFDHIIILVNPAPGNGHIIFYVFKEEPFLLDRLDNYQSLFKERTRESGANEA